MSDRDSPDINSIVIKAVKLMASEVDDAPAEIDGATFLFGRKGFLDSYGLVALLAEIEGVIDDEHEIDITLADERAMSQKTSPFRSVGSLTHYIEQLIGEKNSQ